MMCLLIYGVLLSCCSTVLLNLVLQATATSTGKNLSSRLLDMPVPPATSARAATYQSGVQLSAMASRWALIAGKLSLLHSTA